MLFHTIWGSEQIGAGPCKAHASDSSATSLAPTTGGELGAADGNGDSW